MFFDRVDSATAGDRFPRTLEGVTEWTMADVVEQGSEQHDALAVFFESSALGTLDHLHQPPSIVVHADAMCEASVCRARENKIRDAELLDAPKSLKLRGSD